MSSPDEQHGPVSSLFDLAVTQGCSRRITVVSPHSDDAALSLGCTLRLLGEASLPLRIVTCFSLSDRTNSGRAATETVTSVRKAEDQSFAAWVSRGSTVAVAMTWMDLQDAPLRGYDNNHLAGRLLFPSDREQIDAICGHLVETGAPGELFLFPLGIGGHVDHLISRAAGFELSRDSNRSALFYEDHPYAAGQGVASVENFVGAAAASAKLTAIPYGLPCDTDSGIKEQALAFYPSQRAASWTTQIPFYSAELCVKYGIVERLWAFRS